MHFCFPATISVTPSETEISETTVPVRSNANNFSDVSTKIVSENAETDFTFSTMVSNCLLPVISVT